MTAPDRQHGLTAEQLERMCLTKYRLSDELSARAWGMRCLELRPEVRKLFVYRCPVCRGFHLTRHRGKQTIGEPIKVGIQPAKKIPALNGPGRPAGNQQHEAILP
jgi:hypothetical protein